MFKFNVKWTTAQSSLFHFALSLLVSIIMSVLAACAQYLYSGKFNGQELVVIASAAFIASFSRGIISLESNPNLMPAILDAINELRTLTVAQPAPPQAPFAPYVTIHTGNAPTVEPPAAQAGIRSLNAFPVPPRPQPVVPIQMPVQQPDIAFLNTASQTAVQPPPQVAFAERSFSQPLPVVQSGQ